MEVITNIPPTMPGTSQQGDKVTPHQRTPKKQKRTTTQVNSKIGKMVEKRLRFEIILPNLLPKEVNIEPNAIIVLQLMLPKVLMGLLHYGII